MRNPQLLFGSPVLGDSERSACSLALVAPSRPFTPMSMNRADYTESAGDWQSDFPFCYHR